VATWNKTGIRNTEARLPYHCLRRKAVSIKHYKWETSIKNSTFRHRAAILRELRAEERNVSTTR